MAETTFRKAEDIKAEKESQQAEERVVEKTPPRPAEEGNTPTPIALYQELKGVPYTAEFFEVKEIWDNPDIDLKDDILVIEEAYKQKIEFGELEDGEESFKEFIKEAERATNTKHSPTVVKIAKIAEWVRFMKKMDEIDKLRRKYGNY